MQGKPCYILGMTHRPTTIERAYELAKSGTCNNVEEILAKLTAESYFDAKSQLYGPVLRKELNALCKATRSP